MFFALICPLAFIPLFVAIDPIGLVPMFLSLSSNVEEPQRRAASWHAVTTAFLVGICFLFLGKLVFRALGITVADFQIAGGIILLVLSVQDLRAWYDESQASWQVASGFVLDPVARTVSVEIRDLGNWALVVSQFQSQTYLPLVKR